MTDGSLALGHVRLAVIDPSKHAHQPMRTADGLGVLVYNGEVYNFPELRAELEAEGLAPSQPGKGRNAWYCFGYLLSQDRHDVVALHDCDILTYTRDMPARLFYPVANPDLDFRDRKSVV